MFRGHLGKIPRSDRPFDGFEERILPDALSAAENKSVIDLLLWPLNPMSQPVDDMIRRVAENVLGVVKPNSGVGRLPALDHWRSI